MALNQIDIELMTLAVSTLDRIISDGPQVAESLASRLRSVELTVPVLGKWKWDGASIAGLSELRKDLQRRLDKAIEVSQYVPSLVSQQVGWGPGMGAQAPVHHVVSFEEDPAVSLGDAETAADLINQIIAGDGQVDPAKVQQLTQLLAAGQLDTAFTLRLTSRVPPDRLTGFLNLVNNKLYELSDPNNPLADPLSNPEYVSFRDSYVQLLEALGVSYSTAYNALPEGSAEQAQMLAAWKKSLEYETCPNLPLLGSLVIARGSWPSDFLEEMTNHVTAVEGAEGAGHWSYPWPVPVIDPGFTLSNGSIPTITDPMYGIWMSAAVSNPGWFQQKYGTGETATVTWDEGAKEPFGNGSGSTTPVSAQIDADIADLLTRRGVDPASWEVFQMAAGIADMNSMPVEGLEGWSPPITTQIIHAIAADQRTAREWDERGWWDKYHHVILGGAIIVLGLALIWTPAGWASVAVGAGLTTATVIDAIYYITEGDTLTGVLELVLLPVVVGGVIKLVGVGAKACQALKAGEGLDTIYGRLFMVGGKPTLMSADQWATATAGGTVTISGESYGVVGTRLVRISETEMAALQPGKTITTIEGFHFINTDGKIIGFTKDQWANLTAGKTTGWNGQPVRLVNGKLEILKFDPDLDQHLIYGEGINKRGIKGAHNLTEFENVYRNLGVDPADGIISKTEIHPGVYQIKYRVPALDNSSKVPDPSNPVWKTPSKDPKTVYDPAVVSDADMAKWGREAMANAKLTNDPSGILYEGTASNGWTFQGYLRNGEFTSVFPV